MMFYKICLRKALGNNEKRGETGQKEISASQRKKLILDATNGRPPALVKSMTLSRAKLIVMAPTAMSAVPSINS
jgi:hypothetical protein